MSINEEKIKCVKMAYAIALQPWPQAIRLPKPQIHRKFLEVVKEGLQLLKFERASAQEKANEIKETVSKHISTNFGKHFPKKEDGEKEKQELRVVVAETHEEAARQLVAPLVGVADREQIDFQYNNFLEEFIDGTFAQYNEEAALAVVDLQAIEEKYPDKRLQDSAFYLSIIHETLHHYGSVGKEFYGHSLEWLNEGIAEMLTREIASKLYGKIVRDGSWDKAYDSQVHITNLTVDLVEKDTLLKAFFGKTSAPLLAKLKKLGISEPEIKKLFEMGENLHNEEKSPASDAFTLFAVYLKQLKARRQPKQIEADEHGGDNLPAKAGEAINELKSSSATLDSEASVQHYINALWGFFGLAFPGNAPRHSAPKLNYIVARTREQEKELKKLPHELPPIYYDPKINTMAVIPYKFSQLTKPLVAELSQAVFGAYLAKNFGFGERKIVNLSESAIFEALYFHYLGKLQTVAGVTFTGKEDWRQVLLGDKITEIIGSHNAKRWFFYQDKEALQEGFREKFGERSNLLNLQMSFFDEPITHLSVLLSALEKYPDGQPKLEKVDFAVTMAFGQFQTAFAQQPYKATLNLVSSMFPEFNDENKSSLASSILFFTYVNGALSADSVALASMALRNSQVPGIISSASTLEVSNPSAGIQMFLNSVILTNLSMGKSMFDSIETAEKFSRQLAAFLNAPTKPNNFGIGQLYADTFRKLSEQLRASGLREYSGEPSILDSDPALAPKIKAYIDKLNHEFSADIYGRLYQQVGFAQSYNKFIGKMLENFMLGVAYSASRQHSSYTQTYSDGGVLYASISGGLIAPVSDLSVQQVQAETGIFPVSKAYGQALASFATSSANRAKLKQETVILDTSSFHTPEVQAWIQNSLSDTKMAHAFFDAAQSGIESCGSRIFISP